MLEQQKMSNGVKKFLTAFLSLLFAPFLLFAAFDDVTLTTDAIINIDSTDLTVSGSSASIESMTVNANTFTIILQTSSTLTVASSDRKYIFSDAPGAVTASRTCTSSESTLALSGASGVTVTISIGDECDASTSSTSGSGGGGTPGSVSTGGGGGAATVPPPAPPLPPPPPPIVPAAEVAQPSPIAQLVSPVFNRTLLPGISHPDVKRLQQILNADSDTRVAASGVGSPGNETEFYGSLTINAVQRFQKKYGIVSSGTPETTGYGLVGPNTRTALSLFGVGVMPAKAAAPALPAPAVVSALFKRGLARGDSNTDIKRLQMILNTDSSTRVAASGVGSPGNETNYFGALTEKAVQKFQEKYGVAVSGDPGYGYVGPKTRAKLGELFGDGLPAAPSSVPTGATEAELKSQLDTLDVQLADLLERAKNLGSGGAPPPPPPPPPSTTPTEAGLKSQLDALNAQLADLLKRAEAL